MDGVVRLESCQLSLSAWVFGVATISVSFVPVCLDGPLIW